jgi:hypothetical protein
VNKLDSAVAHGPAGRTWGTARRALGFAFLFFTCGAVSVVWLESLGEDDHPVFPVPLRNLESLRCTSDRVAAAGLWRTPTGFVDDVGKQDQSSKFIWYIGWKDTTALVAREGGIQGKGEPERWTVEHLPSGGIEGQAGLVLTTDRASGESLQAITIDARTSSFVYTTQNVTGLSNRANVFYGTCWSR